MNSEDLQRTNEFTNYLKSKSFTSKSIKGRLNAIRLFWKWLDLENQEAEEISYSDLLLFMKYKSQRGVTQRTIQNYINTIHHYFEHLIEEQRITKNPAEEIEVKGVKRKTLYYILEPNELQALHNQFPASKPNQIRNKAMLNLLVNQGLTTAELSRLEVEDINLTHGAIDIRGSVKSNGRTLKLESHQIMEFYQYIHEVRKVILETKPKRNYQSKVETYKLFIGDGGTEHFSNYITQLMIQVRKLYPNLINAKQIRASVITKWLRIYNLREVQYMAGHRYISSTENYLENEMEGLIDEVQQFHPLR